VSSCGSHRILLVQGLVLTRTTEDFHFRLVQNTSLSFVRVGDWTLAEPVSVDGNATTVMGRLRRSIVLEKVAAAAKRIVVLSEKGLTERVVNLL